MKYRSVHRLVHSRPPPLIATPWRGISTSGLAGALRGHSAFVHRQHPSCPGEVETPPGRASPFSAWPCSGLSFSGFANDPLLHRSGVLPSGTATDDAVLRREGAGRKPEREPTATAPAASHPRQRRFRCRGWLQDGQTKPPLRRSSAAWNRSRVPQASQNMVAPRQRTDGLTAPIKKHKIQAADAQAGTSSPSVCSVRAAGVCTRNSEANPATRLGAPVRRRSAG